MMKYKVKFIITITLSFFFNVIPVCSQDNSKEATVESFERAKQEYTSRSDDEKKLQFGTYELLRLAEAADTSAEANKKFKEILRIDKSLKADSKDRVRVMIRMRLITNRADVINLIQSFGGVVEETYQDFPYVLCRIHPKKLRTLASLLSVVTIKRNIEGVNQSVKQ